MRTAAIPLLLLSLSAACSAPRAGGASPDDTVRRWTAAIEAKDFAAASELMAPGYKDTWLVRTLAALPAFGTFIPGTKEAVARIREQHGFTVDGLEFQDEEQFLDAVRARIDAVEDREALLADVLRAHMELVRWAGNQTGYAEDRDRPADWKALLSDTRTVEIEGRWFVVLDLPTASD